MQKELASIILVSCNQLLHNHTATILDFLEKNSCIIVHLFLLSAKKSVGHNHSGDLKRNSDMDCKRLWEIDFCSYLEM